MNIIRTHNAAMVLWFIQPTNYTHYISDEFSLLNITFFVRGTHQRYAPVSCGVRSPLCFIHIYLLWMNRRNKANKRKNEKEREKNNRNRQMCFFKSHFFLPLTITHTTSETKSLLSIAATNNDSWLASRLWKHGKIRESKIHRVWLIRFVAIKDDFSLIHAQAHTHTRCGIDCLVDDMKKNLIVNQSNI